jgi:O-methyltransferase involved in polyketide biosynthesis
MVAHLRSYSNIPYSKEIDELYEAKSAFLEIAGKRADEFLFTAVWMELRYQSLTNSIKDHGCDNIIEIAAGLSPRGLNYTRNNNAVRYVEIDLPEMIEGKRRMMQFYKEQIREGYLRLCEVDIFSKSGLHSAAEHLEGSICVINEGLLDYLTMDEKSTLALNIHDLLSQRGGSWLTSDLFYPSMVHLNSAMREVMENMSKIIKRNLPGNFFESLASAEKFYRDLGFEIKRLNQRDLVKKLQSLSQVEITPQELWHILSFSYLWVLKPR